MTRACVNLAAVMAMAVGLVLYPLVFYVGLIALFFSLLTERPEPNPRPGFLEIGPQGRDRL